MTICTARESEQAVMVANRLIMRRIMICFGLIFLKLKTGAKIQQYSMIQTVVLCRKQGLKCVFLHYGFAENFVPLQTFFERFFMAEDLHLVSDLALILISAGIVTVIFKLLKQPLVLGYIVAGFLVGPNFYLFPTVMEQNVVSEWSEIGIIFLLFALGLEFSFKKLLKMGTTALIASFAEIMLMFSLGFVTGYLLHWTVMESIFLGGMLAMSSTTIIIKAFDDMGLKKFHFADLTMVILIIQDIVAILMMVLLSTAAGSQKFAGWDMIYCVLKLIFFMILWFVIGITVIPTFFRKAKKYINDETLLIISIGLCFGMVIFATAVGFSSALGAFVMGSILCETVEGEHIEKLIKGIKDLFGAIFFVSVGMMVDPKILVEYWGTILLLTIIVLVVKAFVSSVSVLLAGENLETSLKTGFSLAQIGEFAFIIASLGVSLGVMRPFIYPIIVAVAVITTFTTPYCIRAAEPVDRFLNRRLSPERKARLDRYCITGTVQRPSRGWKIVIKTSLTRTIIFGVCTFAAIIASVKFLYPFTLKEFGGLMNPKILGVLNCVVLIMFISPFLYGLTHHSVKTQDIYSSLWRYDNSSRIAIVGWTLFRIFLACFFVVLSLSKYFIFTRWVVLLITAAIIIFISFSQRILRRYIRIEDSFIHNLKAKEEEEKNAATTVDHQDA